MRSAAYLGDLVHKIYDFLHVPKRRIACAAQQGPDPETGRGVSRGNPRRSDRSPSHGTPAAHIAHLFVTNTTGARAKVTSQSLAITT